MGKKPSLQKDRKTEQRVQVKEKKKHTYRIQQFPLYHSHFFTLSHTKKCTQTAKQTVKNCFREKKHDWTLDTCLLCSHLVTREKQVWEVEEKRVLGGQRGGRLREGDPAAVISWPWRPWLNFAAGWPVSQIPFLPLRHKDTISYLLASESVRETTKYSFSLLDIHAHLWNDWQ